MTRPKTVALYARVSSQKQADENTIASQISAIRQRVKDDQLHVHPDMEFCDNGYSGAELLRPALEQLRDRVATSTVDRVYVHSPDRLSRKMSHQAILLEEFHKYECEVVFLNQSEKSDTPEANLLIQMQGMIAEYEREKILERTRRGRKHSAMQGNVSVFGGAPYGYRYINKSQGDGIARWDIDPVQSKHVQLMFQWVGNDGCTLAEVARRLNERSIKTATGKSRWDRTTIRDIVMNPAYHGRAIYGRERLVPRKTAKRPRRGAPAVPRQAKVTVPTDPVDQVVISVPAIIDQPLFEEVRKRMDENRKRQRERRTGAVYLLSGLMTCGVCGSAYCSRRTQGAKYYYYRCIGADKYRRGGSSVCDNTSVKGEQIETLVWSEVCKFLRDPSQLRAELERRREEPSSTNQHLRELERSVAELRMRLDRLIDGYEAGLLERHEFEHRITPLRERHARELSALESLRGHASRELDFDSAQTALQSLTNQVGEQLHRADNELKRDLIKLLVDRIEIHRDEIRLVYKVPQNPFVQSPDSRGFLQHCLSRPAVASPLIA